MVHLHNKYYQLLSRDGSNLGNETNLVLTAGQATASGYTGYWNTGGNATFYVEALESGTSVLSYWVFGEGEADGIHCRASLTMTAWSVEFVSLYDTFNPANRIFNATPKDDPPEIPSNKLYLVESPDLRCYQARLTVSCEPPDLLNRLIAAVHYNGNKLAMTDTPIIPDGTTETEGATTLVFADASLIAGITDYPVIVGVDWNGNHLLDDDEIFSNFQVKNPATGTAIGPPVIRGSDGAKYNESLRALSTGSGNYPFNPVSHASALLRIFIDGNLLGLSSSKTPSGISPVPMDAFNGYFSEWLTHNAGAPFNAAGVADIQEYRWDSTNSLGILVGESPQMGNAVTAYYENTVFHQVTNDFANLPVGTVRYYPSLVGEYEVPYASLSPPWVPGSTVEFNAGALIPAPLDDLFSAIARARIVSHKVRYTVEKQHSIIWGERLIVTGVQSWGEIEDLYDFNQEAGQLSEWGATVQLGYGNGHHAAYRNAGKIYRTRIFFNKTYTKLP